MRISDWSSDVCSSDLLASQARANSTARSRERSHRPVKSVGSRIVRGVTINSTEETSRYHGREGISGRRRLQRGLHQLVSTSGYGLVRLQRMRGDIPSRKFISFHAGIGLIISRSGKLWVEDRKSTR